MRPISSALPPAPLSEWSEPANRERSPGSLRLPIDDQLDNLTAGYQKAVALRTGAPTGPSATGFTRGRPDYYLTLDQIRARVQGLVARYPDLLEVIDIGDSGDKTRDNGRPGFEIEMVRMTNQAVPNANKGKFLAEAGAHPREIANPHLALDWIEQSLEAHGSDPEMTALLDHVVSDFILVANPDGKRIVDAAYERGERSYQRKSASRVDLNRNYPAGWGGPGASDNPSAQTYRGPAPASEPEIASQVRWFDRNVLRAAIDESSDPGERAYLEHLWEKRHFDIPPGERTEENVHYATAQSVHSYSELNLYPYGDSPEPSPHHHVFVPMTAQFSAFNAYAPIPGVELYPTSGTSEYFYLQSLLEGARATLHTTLETGTRFHQNDTEYEDTKKKVLPVLTYSAMLSLRPDAVKGPMVTDTRFDIATRTLSANVSTSAHHRVQLEGTDIIKKPGVPLSQVVVSTEPVEGPNNRILGAMRAKSGVNTNAPDQSLTLDLSAFAGTIPRGQSQLVYLHPEDREGNVGLPQPEFIHGTGSPSPTTVA